VKIASLQNRLNIISSFYSIFNKKEHRKKKFFYHFNSEDESMSEKLIGACIFGQSGGPTSVINASAYGVIRAALDAEEITNVYGAAHGIKGVLDDKLYVMEEEDPDELRLLLNTPSSELGSCRYKIADPDVDDTDYKRILEIFKKYNVRYFFYNGGNDSMDTCNKISKYMQKVGYECRVNGVPKTIDNDLFGTDHCPGFASAAKYIATSCMEINKDARVYDTGMVTIVEIMGRHAGWLAASAALATEYGSGPDLIYLPETDFVMDDFIADVKKIYDESGKVLVAVSEGIHYADGTFVAEAKTSATDGFGHAQLGGLATLLAAVVKERMGCKVRGVELSLLQRCGAHLASATDIQEAQAAGAQAVKAALDGITDKMVAFERSTDENGKYVCGMKLIPLSDVANYEKKVPLEWINETKNGVKKEFIDYVLPLIQGEPEIPRVDSLPRYAKLKKVLAK
jgi:6-phosphofructokinase 1